MARGVSALDFVVSPLHSFARRRRLINMSSVSGRFICFILFVLLAFLGIYFTQYLRPALKSLPKGTRMDWKLRHDVETSYRHKELVRLKDTRGQAVGPIAVKAAQPQDSDVESRNVLKKEPEEIGRKRVENGTKEGEITKKWAKHVFIDTQGNEIAIEKVNASKTDKLKEALQLPVVRRIKQAPKVADQTPTQAPKDMVADKDKIPANSQNFLNIEIGSSNNGQKFLSPTLVHSTSITGINRVVHLTWRSDKLPNIVHTLVKEWPKTNPILKIAFWDDETMDTFVRGHFQDFYSTWKLYTFVIDKVRAFQILVLCQIGGIYSDIDVLPREPLKGVTNQYPCILAQDNPVACRFYKKPTSPDAPCISMHLMACRAGHPYLTMLIENLKAAAESSDCSIKPCVTADILAKTFTNFKKLGPFGHRNTVLLANADYFSSTFDPAQRANIQSACDNKALDSAQQRLCTTLRADGFQSKVSNSSYVVHKYMHTWGAASNENQARIQDGYYSIYDLIDNAINGKVLMQG
jgi:mannosyltransferase OCH1-like enzyme